jgi:outer membrane lipoprotein-sorting protein
MNLKFPNSLSGSALWHRGTAGRTSAVFSVLCLSGVLVQPGYAQGTEAILGAVQQAEANVKYSATQVVQRGSEREVARLYRDGVKKRIEWIAPAVRKGDVLVDDGKNVTLYHSSDKSAIQTRSQRRLPNLTGGGWKIGAPVKQNGTIVRVLSRGDGRRLTIDDLTSAIIRMEGQRGITTLQNVRYGAVPASKFVFVAPPGAKITRINGQLYNDLRIARRRATWLKAPAQLPAGYNFESAIVSPSEVWLRYTNGRKRFSIFQQKAEGADLGPQKVNNDWFWRSGGVRFLAIDAPSAAVPNMASSLK